MKYLTAIITALGAVIYALLQNNKIKKIENNKLKQDKETLNDIVKVKNMQQYISKNVDTTSAGKRKWLQKWRKHH
jgi:Na+-translocating ferredoxin:NAD+ oxidoreductase RnfG subunit